MSHAWRVIRQDSHGARSASDASRGAACEEDGASSMVFDIVHWSSLTP